MKPTAKNERRIVIGLLLVSLASAALVGWLKPGLVRFWPFTVGDFLQLITPLFLVALFIERVLEVFLTSWRAAESKKLELAAKREVRDATNDDAKTAEEPETALADYKSRTQRIALLSGTAIGVIISALGVRILELFVDPAVFQNLSSAQQTLFRIADVLFTGAVLGGGSEGLHKLVRVFTNFMESSAERAKSRGEG